MWLTVQDDNHEGILPTVFSKMGETDYTINFNVTQKTIVARGGVCIE